MIEKENSTSDFFKDVDRFMGDVLTNATLKRENIGPAGKPWAESFKKPINTLFSMASSDEYHRRSSREELLAMGDKFMGEELRNSSVIDFT